MYRSAQGYTLFEFLAVLTVISIGSVIALTSLRNLSDPLVTGSAETVAFLRRVRAKAIATTSAYEVVPEGNARMVAKYAATCSADAFVTDPKLSLDLPHGANFTATDWTLCFTARGLSNENKTILVAETSAEEGATPRERTIELYLGGAVREYR